MTWLLGLWLFGCAGGAGGGAGGDAGQPPVPPAGDHETGAIGQAVTFGDRTFTVTEAFLYQDNLPSHRGFMADPQPGKRFIEVRFTEKNLLPNEVSHLFLPRLADDRGTAHDGVTVGIAKLYMPKGALEYRWHTLLAGEEKAFVGLYEVADPAAKGFRIEVWPYEGNVGKTWHIPLGI